ncbi:MAG: SPASM domain-containing protein [Candidatus Methanodesulfokora sp.]
MRINVDEHNIESIQKFIDYLADIGLLKKIKIGISPIIPDQMNCYNPCKYSKNYVEYYLNIMNKIIYLLEYAVNRGFIISNKFVRGPCIGDIDYSFAVDENLNIYKCPALLYMQPDGNITEMGELDIKSPNWFRYIVDEPLCIKDCKYAPICFGGCKYLRSKNIRECLSSLYPRILLEKLIRLYVVSNYREKNRAMGETL